MPDIESAHGPLPEHENEFTRMAAQLNPGVRSLFERYPEAEDSLYKTFEFLRGQYALDGKDIPRIRVGLVGEIDEHLRGSLEKSEQWRTGLPRKDARRKFLRRINKNDRYPATLLVRVVDEQGYESPADTARLQDEEDRLG